MVEVKCQFGIPTGHTVVTELWISKEVEKAILAHERAGKFLSKLRTYCEGGFRNFTGPIRLEWDGVYRISDNKLFRIFGFYERYGESFIAVKAITKGGQKLNKRERAIIDTVAAIKQTDNWKKNVYELH